jgi:CRISPR-associated protein Csm2
MARPSDADLRAIVTDPDGAETLVKWADDLGKYLKDAGLTTSQIRTLFGEVRQIQAEWGIPNHRGLALRRLILLKPKMAYRARKERGKAVEDLVSVLRPALDLVVKAKPRSDDGVPGSKDTQDDNLQRFVEFFEAILAYHKAYGGN